MADHSTENSTPGYTTYGGVQDRPDDVNHPDNVATEATSTDPSAAPVTTVDAVPEGFSYNPETDTYTRNGQ